MAAAKISTVKKSIPPKEDSATKVPDGPKRLISSRSLRIIFYVLMWLIASYIFYRRFPYNYRQPNFYAEDGAVFAYSIMTHGFWHSILTTFNGYYIWGIYIIEKIGFIFNSLFYGGQFADLPRSFALVSYGYLGLMAVLPMLLFRRYFKFIPVLLIGILIAYVPLRASDYAVIGTIGNLKFSFVYVAFSLLYYRHLLPEKSKKIYIVDLALVICAYTDITVYPMLLFALLRYWPKFNFRKPLNSLRELVMRDRTFQSLIGLVILLLPQLYVVKKDGVPTIPGYLTGAFNFHRTIEIFISRSYIYGILFPGVKNFDNITVIAVFIVAVALAVLAARKYWSLFIFGAISIFLATFLFVIKRTGVSALFMGYKSGGPDQFFYAQNWIFSVIVVLLFVELIRKFRLAITKFLGFLVLFAIAIFYIAPNASAYGLNTFMATTVGNIYSVAQKDCQSSNSVFNVAIYPTKPWVFQNVTRKQLCTASVINYQSQEISLGLAPDSNDYVTVTNTKFTQSFTSPDNNLNGLDIYFSTFGSRVTTPYTLDLYNSSCKQLISSTSIAVKSLGDNEISSVSFPTVNNSANQKYCFTIVSDRNLNPSPLAVQLSAPNAYSGGIATVNGKTTDRDVVFDLHYK